MITCKKASELISQSLDQPLTWSNRFQLRFHLIICKYCARFNEQLLAIKNTVKNMQQATENDQSIQLSNSAKAKIIERINQETSAKSH